MMKKKIFLLIFWTCTFSQVINAQTDVDAFRYSGSSITGTTRYSSMAGAFGAVGGNFSCLSNNPAGIGIYRSSEFSLSPAIYVGSTTSQFLNSSFRENRFNLNFGNIGMVYTKMLTKKEDDEGWKSLNFGFGYNRTDNYQNRSSYEDLNPSNSFTNYFAEQAEGIDPANLDEYYEGLAYNTYLINPDSLISTHYLPAVSAGQVTQRRSQQSRGSKGEFDLSFGANYGNKLFLGATLGFASLRYLEDVTYEELTQNSADSLKHFTFDQNLTTRGSGINLKLGIIYRAADWVRFGAALHTPTWFSMRDEYINTMKSKFNNGTSFSQESPAGAFDYELTTPLKAIGSVALLFQKSGLLSADFEFSDISQARLDASGYAFTDANNAIRKKYQAVSTIRLGAEWRIGNYSIRGGTAMTSTPISSAYRVSGSDFSRTCYTGGFGIRDHNIFIDLGYVYSQSNEFFQPYTLSDQLVPGVKNKVHSQSFNLTFGVKF